MLEASFRLMSVVCNVCPSNLCTQVTYLLLNLFLLVTVALSDMRRLPLFQLYTHSVIIKFFDVKVVTHNYITIFV